MKILYLCTGNSCRSQMAEGWTRKLRPEYEVFSAGVAKHGMNEYALKVMAEAGVDISDQYSKTTDELPNMSFDYVVTLCGHAAENCPFFPGAAKRLHRGFDDPPLLAKKASGEEEVLEAYRSVRDQIKAFVEKLPESLED